MATAEVSQARTQTARQPGQVLSEVASQRNRVECSSLSRHGSKGRLVRPGISQRIKRLILSCRERFSTKSSCNHWSSASTRLHATSTFRRIASAISQMEARDYRRYRASARQVLRVFPEFWLGLGGLRQPARKESDLAKDRTEDPRPDSLAGRGSPPESPRGSSSPK